MKIYLLAIHIIYLLNACVCEDPTYTTKYDGIDLDEILANERLLSGYVNCLLEIGPCTPDGKELKNNLPDAIQNDCRKCTEKQRDGANKVMGYIIDHNPEDWTKLEKKYNSDGSYKQKYLDSKETKTKTTESKGIDNVGEKSKEESE